VLYRPDNSTIKCPARFDGAGHFGGRENAAGMSLHEPGNPAAVSAWRGGM